MLYRFLSPNLNTLPRGICAVLPKALRPLRAPPIRCRLCHCRRIKQLMQYPPFSSPPIKGLSKRPFHTLRTVTNTSYIHFKFEQPHFVRLLQGSFFCARAHSICWVKLCLHSLLLFRDRHDVGLTLTKLVVLQFLLQYCPVCLGPLYHRSLRTSETVPPLL